MDKNYTILLVDDEPDILEFLTYNLKKEGYIVYQAQTGKEAVKIAKEIIPHLILLDVMMPEMDGFEVCSRIRELADMPVLMLTARSSDLDKVMGLESGADDYLVKPVPSGVLVAHINNLTRRASAEKNGSRLNSALPAPNLNPLSASAGWE